MCSYDKYKLSNPCDDRYNSDYVSNCCGAEVTRHISDDEHMNEAILCYDCDCECEEIEQYEYDEIQRENYLEMCADEMRDLR